MFSRIEFQITKLYQPTKSTQESIEKKLGKINNKLPGTSNSGLKIPRIKDPKEFRALLPDKRLFI